MLSAIVRMSRVDWHWLAAFENSARAPSRREASMFSCSSYPPSHAGLQLALTSLNALLSSISSPFPWADQSYNTPPSVSIPGHQQPPPPLKSNQAPEAASLPATQPVTQAVTNKTDGARSPYWPPLFPIHQPSTFGPGIIQATAFIRPSTIEKEKENPAAVCSVRPCPGPVPICCLPPTPCNSTR